MLVIDKKKFFLVGLNGITFWPEWGLTNLSFRPRPSGLWPERQNFKGLKGIVLNVRKPNIFLRKKAAGTTIADFV